jgi:uncharacterized protein YcfL
MNAVNRHSSSEGMTMWGNNRRILAAIGLVGLLLAACSGTSPESAPKEAAVVVEKNEATGISKLALSAKAAERLGIATAAVADAPAGRGTAVPYSAIVYDKNGATWAYTNPEGFVFLRAAITVERIAEDLAILSSGPPVGTSVVTVGTAELWGVETGVGGGH